MDVRILINERDKNRAAVRDVVEQALSQANITDATIEEVLVTNDDDARIQKCIGSPTVRIDGWDIEYAEREPPETTSGARYYSTPEGWLQMPTVGMVVYAIREALNRAGR